MVADTLYDILGVPPAADVLEIVKAYQIRVAAAMAGGDYKGSMWWCEPLDKIAEMTEAMKTLVHGDRRAVYNKKLIAACIVCALCEGRGKNKFYGGLQERTCMACGGSGKASIEED